MSNSVFRFKQFTVCQDKCAMKVGTDGVLLGAWAEVDNADKALDIGTGTGLVALMLAQRSGVRITALEIDAAAAEQAVENIGKSSWKERIEVVCTDFNDYYCTAKEKFDLIVSNPPYFVDSLNAPEKARSMARHNDSLTYDSLLKGVADLLTENGRFFLIIPFDVLEKVEQIAKEYGLCSYRQLRVITAPGKSPKRVLVAFSFQPEELKIEELLVEKERHVYSDAYVKLTREFYLKM